MGRPKWSLNSVEESDTVYVGTVKGMIDDLSLLPPEAEAEIPTSYHECYGHDEITVTWKRDMTDVEYEKERLRRRKANAKAKEEKEEAERKHREHVEAEAKKLGLL